MIPSQPEKVEYRDHAICQIERDLWQVRDAEPIDNAVYYEGCTVGECIEAIDAVFDEY